MSGSLRDEAHAEKLAALGTRIVAVIHEISGPLSLVAGSVEALETDLAAVATFVREARAGELGTAARTRSEELDLARRLETAEELLQIARQGAATLAHLVEQIRGFARKPEEPATDDVVEVRAALMEAIRSVRMDRRRPSACEPRIDVDAEHLHARGNHAGLVSVLSNLVGNAWDAVAKVPDPQIRIGAAAESPWVEISIRDNGVGIAPANHERIFAPFFTTKEHGAGLGLGLAIAKELVEQWGGTVAVTAAAEHGTELRVRLRSR